MPTGKAVQAVVKCYFTAVLFMMYYFINDAVFIGGIGVTLRHIFALLTLSLIHILGIKLYSVLYGKFLHRSDRWEW